MVYIMQPQTFHGLLVLDKPLGMSSRDAVNRALEWFPPGTRIGHTGTLDPLASGVLVLCIGAATRLAEYVQRMEKVYRACIRLDATSDTDDAEGTITEVVGAAPPSRESIQSTLLEFVGEIEQVPPTFSAALITGRRAYELARKGRQVTLEPRRVRIHDLLLVSYAFPELEIEVRCGKGTYIRSLARDLGVRLGTGGMLTALRRTRVGHFQAHDALDLESNLNVARAHLLPLVEAVRDLPTVRLPPEKLELLSHGVAVLCAEPLPDACSVEREVAVMTPCGQFFALARLEGEKKVLLPQKVFGHTPKQE